jgi:hypothetical protein
MSGLLLSVRVYRFAVFAVLVIASILAVSSALEDSQTHDEGVHLTAGYSYWKTGDFRLSPEHPPLGKLLAALPLLWFQPDFEPPAESWQHADPWPISKAFIYSNRVSADLILMAGRVSVIAMYLVLAASLAWWVGRVSGRAASLAALILFAFEPTVLAQSRYVTTDIPVTLFIWLAMISWFFYLERGTNWLLVLTGLLTGFAFATKFNALILPVVFVLTWNRASKVQWWRIPAIVGIAILAALSVYGFNAQSVAEDPSLATRSLDIGAPDGISARAIHFRVPGYYFLRGIHMLLRHEIGGYPAYFMGDISPRGTWLYFPVAFLLKSSIAWLALMLLAGIVAVASRSRPNLRVLAMPVFVYCAFALISSFNIGIRHLLPVYPFLCAFAAIVLFDIQQKPFVKALGVILLALFLAESATAYPNYVAFFNAGVGGPKAGHRYLADSNLDWGQDLRRLDQHLRAHGIDRVCLGYFGTAEPSFYGIQSQPLPVLKTLEDLNQLDCVAAVSAQYLFATKGRPFEALSRLKPTAWGGASILIYDLRRESDLSRSLAAQTDP